MNFQVNGIQYFLNFVDDESRWFVFEPTLTGINRIPVYVDGNNRPDYIAVRDDGQQKRRN